MTVDELRNELALLPGDAVVRLWCDHGQASMKATTVTALNMREKDRQSWMCDDGGNEPEDGEPINVVEIGSP